MIGVELAVQLRRVSYRVVLAGLAVVTVTITVVIAATSGTVPERLGDSSSVVPDSSGLTMAAIALNTLLLFLLPLAVAVFAGESVAGPASWGSLRYALARPGSRLRLLAPKVGVAAGCSVAAVLVVLVTGLVTGVLAFGLHPLDVLDLDHATPFTSGVSGFAPGAATVRLLVPVAVLTLAALLPTFACSVLCSVLTDRPAVAVAGGILLTFASRALDDVPGLQAVGPWLPVTDHGVNAWTGVLVTPVDVGALWHPVLVQLGYGAAFLVAAAVAFRTRDVFS